MTVGRQNHTGHRHAGLDEESCHLHGIEISMRQISRLNEAFYNLLKAFCEWPICVPGKLQHRAR
jgi:hypothetical protein